MTTTAAAFAKEIGVNPQSPRSFNLKRKSLGKLCDFLDEGSTNGKLGLYFSEIIDLTSFWAVLNATMLVADSRYHKAAVGLGRSISTARMCPVAAWKVQELSPYRVCLLLGRIVKECETLTTAEVDQWLRDHREELANPTV